MLKEVSDQFEVLSLVHSSIDNMIGDLSDEQWVLQPRDNLNNIASIVHHIILVEKKFMSAISGAPLDIDTGAPFKDPHLDVAAIRKAWANSLSQSRAVLDGLSDADLDKPGLSLRIGDLNKRQLITYTVGHTTHHRGQVPLILKMI